MKGWMLDSHSSFDGKMESMRILSCCMIFALVYGEWQTYEDPIQLATPNPVREGIKIGILGRSVWVWVWTQLRIFDVFSIEHNASCLRRKICRPLVFRPLDSIFQARWIRLNSTLESLCNASNVITDNLDYALQDINQLNGLHIRFISVNGKM